LSRSALELDLSSAADYCKFWLWRMQMLFLCLIYHW